MVWPGILPSKRRRRQLPFPAAPGLRIAQLGETATFDGVVAFPDEGIGDLEAFAPQVLAAPSEALVAAAHAVFNGDLLLESVDSAIFILIYIGDKPATPPERDLIWRAFRVPMYELYLDEESNLLASECEAHGGWHLRNPNIRFLFEDGELILHRTAQPPFQTGLTASCTDGRCACGDTSPLLRAVTENVKSLAVRSS